MSSKTTKEKTMIQTVVIPACVEHWGMYYMVCKVEWKCPECGGPRGQIKKVFSYDGSRRMICDGWENPCGHIDKYAKVREEAKTNGLNKEIHAGLIDPGVNNRYDPETWLLREELVGN